MTADLTPDSDSQRSESNPEGDPYRYEPAALDLDGISVELHLAANHPEDNPGFPERLRTAIVPELIEEIEVLREREEELKQEFVQLLTDTARTVEKTFGAGPSELKQLERAVRIAEHSQKVLFESRQDERQKRLAAERELAGRIPLDSPDRRGLSASELAETLARLLNRYSPGNELQRSALQTALALLEKELPESYSKDSPAFETREEIGAIALETFADRQQEEYGFLLREAPGVADAREQAARLRAVKVKTPASLNELPDQVSDRFEGHRVDAPSPVELESTATEGN